MLAKEYRLPQHSRFSHSLTRKTPFFLIRIQKNNLSISRFGFVVSKKVDKRAVVRNRIRRVFRSYIEQEIKNIISEYDVLFVLSPTLKNSQGEEVKDLLFKTLQETKLLKRS